MDSKLNSIVMTSILSFALIAGIAVAFEMCLYKTNLEMQLKAKME
jgi:hypothetical protein